jgi:hypothetical protein
LKKVFKNTGNFILMMVLLVATSGMSIYRLHCNCMQKEYISVFIEPESCHPAGHSHCCSNSQQCSYGNQQKGNHSCAGCDTLNAFFVKLTTVFIPEAPNIVTSPVQVMIFNTLFSDLLFQGMEDESTISGEIINSPPPLIIPGQKIVMLYHQFKFDLHFSIA